MSVPSAGEPAPLGPPIPRYWRPRGSLRISTRFSYSRTPSEHARTPRARPSGKFTFTSGAAAVGLTSRHESSRATMARARTAQAPALPFEGMENAMAGTPRSAPSRAAATVPE